MTGRINEADLAIARRIKDRRVMLGITQMGLAAELGVTFQQLQKYEKGQNRISGGRIAMMARALQISPEELLAIEPVEAGSEPDRLMLEIFRELKKLSREQRAVLLPLIRHMGATKRRSGADD